VRGYGPFMLSYAEALNRILRHTTLLKVRPLPLSECLGRVLGENIYSPLDFPHFDNAAVDGYAVGKNFQGQGTAQLRFAATRPRRETAGGYCSRHFRQGGGVFRCELEVQGEIPAGGIFEGGLRFQHAIRIFTGAPVPKGTKAVVMQEHTERQNGSVLILKSPERYENIRFRGEDFRKGDLLLKKGTMLEPSHLALLATVGCKKAPVYPAPKIAILATGNELLKSGERLSAGKIFDSNTILLEAMVHRNGGDPQVLCPAGDSIREIHKAVKMGLECDVLIVAGGVSVGKYDFVKKALAREGVGEIFWKVDIKPGKPLYFGKKNQTLVFGLPGNPVSVFVTFEEFVKPALLKMGGKRIEAKWKEGLLTQGFENGARPHFVRVRCESEKGAVRIILLKGQGSHQISALARSNALLKVEPYEILKKNQKVRVKMMQEANV